MPDWVLGQNIIEAIKENFKAQKCVPIDILIVNPIQNISLKNKEEVRRSNVKWKAPQKGWIKGKFDGAAKGNLRKVGCGGIIRDHLGNAIDVTTIPIGIATSHRAKATMALYTMRLAVKTGKRYLWLEGDSLNIINILNDITPSTWTIEESIFEIKSLTANFEKVIFSHSYHEGNVINDWIANRVVQGNYLLSWHNDLSSSVDLKSLINYDRIYATKGNIS